MTRTPVQSSQIKSVGYNASSAVLEIEFSDGSVFQYQGVPLSVYELLMDSESAGSTFHKIVKGKFGHKKV